METEIAKDWPLFLNTMKDKIKAGDFEIKHEKTNVWIFNNYHRWRIQKVIKRMLQVYQRFNNL